MQKCIVEDTRQKTDKNAHITKQLESMGFKVVRNKLIVGDYTWPTDQHICVDTKFGLQEVAGNLTADHERFRRECQLAKELGIQLIILVQEPGIKILSDVCGWYNWRKKKFPKAVSGKQLYKIMATMCEKYGISWIFCNRHNVGECIVRLLNGEKL